jgi:hypothetical protein
VSTIRPTLRWQRSGPKAITAILLFLFLLLDAYILYSIYVERLGNALDYYPFWAGGREVILNRQNPYEPAVMQSIQEAIYGRPALPDENQHGYAYPAYAPFIALPFLLLPFPLSASLWIAIQQFWVIAAALLTIRATGWQIGRWYLLSLCLTAITFRYTMITLVLGQTSVWVLFGLAFALWAAQRRRGVLAGLALAASSLKPQLVLLPALALLVSLPSRQRLRVLLALLGAIIVLLACSWLFAGPWAADFYQQLQAYQGYSRTEFPVAALAGLWMPRPTSKVLNGLAIIALLGLLGIGLWHWRGSGQVAFPVAMAVIVTQFAVPQTGSYNMALLLLPAVVALHRLSTESLRGRPRAVAGRVIVLADILIVPWLLWPSVKTDIGAAWELVIVPTLLLIVLTGLLIYHRGHMEEIKHRTKR